MWFAADDDFIVGPEKMVDETVSLHSVPEDEEQRGPAERMDPSREGERIRGREKHRESHLWDSRSESLPTALQ